MKVLVTKVAFGKEYAKCIRDGIRKLLYYDNYSDQKWKEEHKKLIQKPISIREETRTRFTTFMNKIKLKREQLCYFKLKYDHNMNVFVTSRAEALHR